MRRPKQKKKFPRMFPQFFKKEIKGKKYQYGGEYKLDHRFIDRIKRTMKSNGYDVYVEHSKIDGKVVLWTRKR